MISIKYPDIKPFIKKQGAMDLVFCAVRKKWLTLTPEEWVRQNFILFLTNTLQYPISLIAVEKKIKIADVEKRFDLLIYDKEMKPNLLVECKEMNNSITEDTISQVLNYFTTIQSNYIVVTNGNQTFCFEKFGMGLQELNCIPPFKK